MHTRASPRAVAPSWGAAHPRPVAPADRAAVPAVDVRDAAARLVRRLDAADASPSVETLAALRAAVTECVDRLKAGGMPLEQVLAVLRTALGGHGSPRRSQQVLEWGADAFRDDAWW